MAGGIDGSRPGPAPTGLRLLVAAAPAPFVLDVGQATTQPITGLATDGDRLVSVLPVAPGALVVSGRSSGRCRPGSSLYLVRHGSTSAARLGAALQVVPAHDGQSLGDPQAHYELGEVTGDPGGRLAIVEFASYSPEHRLDLWLLDTRARRWRHLLGMPAPMVPKVTDVHRTADGRVVVLSGNPANPAGPS